jgi:FkbM family methyltransferase
MWSVFKKPAEAFFRVLRYYPTTLNGLRFKCDPDHVSFWRLASRNGWEPHSLQILSQFLKKDSVFADIGTWIGPTSIYAAKHCGTVYSFEPDWVAYKYLLWNIELNKLDNVVPFNIALAEEEKLQWMSCFYDGSRGNSTTSLLRTPKPGEGVNALCMRWQTWLDICKPPRIDMMKIDIEGGEFVLLPMLRDYFASHKPVVYLSTHAPYLDKDRRKKEMAQLRDIMSLYRQCLGEDLKPVRLDDLTGDEALNSFRSYVFVD